MTEYSVRRSRRARHARINVGPDGVEVVVPERFPLSRVEPFVAEKRPWIERTLRRYRRSAEVHPPARLEDGGQLPFLGERLDLRVRVEPGRQRAHVARRGDELRVALGPVHDLREELEAWLRRRARAEVEPRLKAATRRAGVRYRGLQIRGQRTRWASCSSSGAMSFNWRLLLAPAGDPRLRDRARGGPPERARPLPALLAAAGQPLPGLPHPRALAARPRAHAAPLSPTPSERSGPPGRRRPAVQAASTARLPPESGPPLIIVVLSRSIACLSGSTSARPSTAVGRADEE